MRTSTSRFGSVVFSSVFAKTLRDLRRGVFGWGIGIAATVALMAIIWPSFSDMDIESLMAEYPETLLEVFNVTDMNTAAGFLNAELYSIMIPAMFIIFAVGRGARLIAGEEEDGTLEILASMPISRPRMLVEKAGALVVAVAGLGLVLFISSWLLSVAVGMDIAVMDLANGALAMSLLGMEYGLIAIAISAGVGRLGVAVAVASLLAGASYLLYLVGQLVSAFEPYLELSAFYQAISAGPIGADLPALVLAMPAVGLVALGLSVPIFTRRDLAV